MTIAIGEIYSLMREYPFLVPFLILSIPFAITFLISIWLFVILRKGESINLEFKAFGAELRMSTIFEVKDAEKN